MAPQDATATDTAAKRAATFDDPPLVSFISLLSGALDSRLSCPQHLDKIVGLRFRHTTAAG